MLSKSSSEKRHTAAHVPPKTTLSTLTTPKAHSQRIAHACTRGGAQHLIKRLGDARPGAKKLLGLSPFPASPKYSRGVICIHMLYRVLVLSCMTD